MAAEYKLLDKTTNYDVDKVRELAKALNELQVVAKRAVFLKGLVDDNHELSRYIHTTKEGVAIAFRDMEDSHIINLAQHLVRSGVQVPAELEGEARERNLTIVSNRLQLSAGTVLEGDDFGGMDDELIDD